MNKNSETLMHRITLIIILLLSATCADAASYQKTDGTIVDPIQSVSGGDLSYSGNNLEVGADLSGAVLNEAFLMDAALWFVDLTNAKLRFANLSGADLTDTDLSGADLWVANLSDTDLTDAHLTGADLTDADLTDANLTGADLSSAVLSGADLWSADLSGSDFSNVYYYDSAIWTHAYYYANNEPTWASGMDAAWRSSVGIVQRSSLGAGSPVPEPSTLLLALSALALLPRRRRR